MGSHRSRVLLEVAEPGRAAAWGRRLLEAGFDVSCCPGPTSEQNGCPLRNGRRCPLVDAAAVVVNALPADAGLRPGSVRRRSSPELVEATSGGARLVEMVRRASVAHSRRRRLPRIVRGHAVVIRGIESSDAEMYRAFDATLSERSRRLRYLGYMPALEAERAIQLATVDFDSRFALVAVASGESRIVADCRLVPAADGRSEVAIAVADDYQGGGLGEFMLELILGIAADRGLQGVTAEVRYDNEAMLRLLRRLGFRRKAWELGVVTLEREADASETGGAIPPVP
jgi:ribosomal protein S18 acetylase RimI-like enzyme